METLAKDNSRPPIVTIMGHIDHGKTTLLDAIRKTNIASSEHGGITQHIGAYQITFQGKPITFIDTPGHAAFEKMRSRGAEVCDMVVLVVAASEGVKPQTTEAISYIKKASRPLIVAFTKVDLPNINIEKAKKELQALGIVVESYGGEVPTVEVAAPKGQGLEDLLEVILLLWQLAPQPSLPTDPLEAVVIESFLDKNRGPVATVIIKKGTLKVGQKITVDQDTISVRSLTDDYGKPVKEALPGKPVEVLGFKKVLGVGSIVNEQIITTKVNQKPLELADLIKRTEAAKDKFKIIIKADVTGSLEAITSNLPEKTLVISSGIGDVTEKDISFAKVTSAPILTFNTKISGGIKSLASREGIVIKNYQVIYELLSDIEDIIASFEQVKHELKIIGRAKIVASFDIEGKKIAGATVTHGRIKVGDNVLIRHANNGSDQSKISSLKKFKKDAETVTSGQQCGIALSENVDFKVGDIIESLG